MPSSARVAAEVALWLDPARMWSVEELAGAAAALRGARHAES